MGVGEGVTAGFETFAPLFHTNFFPDLTHVYFNPLARVIAPSFGQEVPGFTTACATVANDVEITMIEINPATRLFMKASYGLRHRT